ncbi:hypothetical protein SERLADRAFT_372025 [Serpula lacrymans var. lacrymans S7.9]|uniref:Uncharacterized protein n=1 Tax=Serpula lacrymans var. lacrymans (strain S7.9) TaxID=578457 RepID=F8P365_SERL9|nr:uncharacterized protein SERLADRAFT_372025 [Serpula lacrymans var. lacrymans S7.9]EGO22596.1 hypothetical protein SERLADRAFT_372025 [Serpula lacrymans var. lacrymans S7.9]
MEIQTFSSTSEPNELLLAPNLREFDRSIRMCLLGKLDSEYWDQYQSMKSPLICENRKQVNELLIQLEDRSTTCYV